MEKNRSVEIGAQGKKNIRICYFGVYNFLFEKVDEAFWQIDQMKITVGRTTGVFFPKQIYIKQWYDFLALPVGANPCIAFFFKPLH